MRRNRKGGTIEQDFSGPLWDNGSELRGLREVALLEEFLKASSEEHGYFRENWVFPLLAEGVDIDRIFQLLVNGAVRPN